MSSRIGIRSCYSLLWGTATPEIIARYLADQGCTAIAITDRNNLYGLHKTREAARAANLQHITGAELVTPSGSVFAFVNSPDGYRRLCVMLSDTKAHDRFDIIKALAENADGLHLVSTSPAILESLVSRVPALWAGISPGNLGSIPSARRLGLPIAAMDDATFLSGSDHAIHQVLRAIGCGKTVGTLAQEDQEEESRFVLDRSRYERAFASWPEALEQTELIAEACADVTLFDSLIFPEYPVQDSTPGEELRKRVLEGAERRYGEISDAIIERIEYELRIIIRKGFAPYFLVMDDIVEMASRTCGRGSGAASIVSYALGITNVDPIAYNLYFERFLTMAREDPPDIDVDFAWDERDGILRSVIHRFGENHCARVANHNRFQGRSAIRETAKAFGISESEVSRIGGKLLQTGVESVTDPLWHTILTIARSIEGLPRSLSMHCGGMVITPEPINTYAPIERSAEGYPLLAWEKDGTEEAKLVKIDLLGNRSLAVIRDTLEQLCEEGIIIDPDTWHPAEDQATQDALARGDSLGVFYIESPAMRQLQQKTGKGDFDHIVIHSSMIRPAANAFINEYVRRLKGGSWEPLHPRLERVLSETYGILCYQEDVSKTAVALAGFSEAEADTLRKVIAKKANGERLRQYAHRFKEGCRSREVPEKTIDAVWEMMLSFDGYSFCKPHSASYAMVSFQSAYLRVHHGAAFMAAVLSNQGGYYRPQAYVSEIRRMGCLLDGPDINRSRYRYHAEGTTVVVGFMAIANLGSSASKAIVAEREKNGLFSSLEEVSARLPLHRDDIVSLVAAGSFDSLAPGLPRSAHAQRLLITPRNLPGPEAQGELFPLSSRPMTQALEEVQFHRPDSELHREFEALGFLRDHHPLALWARVLARVKRIRAIDLPIHSGQHVSLIGWPITRKTILTKQGLPMDFVSFEDETALYETILFPDVHRRFRNLLNGQRPLIIHGMVKNDQGAVHVQVSSIGTI